MLISQRFWKIFGMASCDPNVVPIQKGDKFNLSQCPQTELEHDRIKSFPYASLAP